MGRTPDDLEAEILLRAIREGWRFAEVGRALREALANLDPFPEPLPTDATPGTADKIAVYVARRGLYALNHPDDRQHNARDDMGNVGTSNRNGRPTELDEVEIRGADAWPDPDPDNDANEAARFDAANWRKDELAWLKVQETLARIHARQHERDRKHPGPKNTPAPG